MTRLLEDARRTAEELAKRGHEALVAPLSDIRFLDSPEPGLDGIQAVLATSGNGVRAFAARCGRTDVSLLAVGTYTAMVARGAGFTQVVSAEGDSDALVAMARRLLDPAAGALLHVTGRPGDGEFCRELANAGFDCRMAELYEIVFRRGLPDEAIAAFGRGIVDAALVLSPESGRRLAEALKAGGVVPECARLVACCISKEAAARIRDIGFGTIRIAEKPTLDAVLDLLDIGAELSASTARERKA